MDKKQKKSSAPVCCVFGCNNRANDSNIQFYNFPTNNPLYPHRAERRKTWLRALKLKNVDGSVWIPTKNDRICSHHFIGNKKSEDPRSPNYSPTIFPETYNISQQGQKAALERHKRSIKRLSREDTSAESKKVKSSVDNSLVQEYPMEQSLLDSPNIIDKNFDDITMKPLQVDQSTQVNFMDDELEYQDIFICNRIILSTKCEAETQCYLPEFKKNTKICVVEKCKTCEKKEKEKNTEEINEQLLCDDGFHGYRSIEHEQGLIDLCGVTRKSFELLLKIYSTRHKLVLPEDSRQKIGDQDNLVIFLMKMKSGLTFSALSKIFKINRRIVSRTFYSILEYLSLACKTFVYWPDRLVVDEAMPEVFKPDYSRCRVVIDSTEFIVEQPPTVEQRVQFYSHYKKGFRIKAVIGCLPSGLICFISKCHGGRASDAQITVSSGLLDLLEPDDMVLADKGFLQIKTLLDEQGKNIVLVMPPFLHNEQFSEEEVKETYKVARVRIHIERIMQRIRTYKIIV